MEWLYPRRVVAHPAFVTDAERAETEREIGALASAGPAREYLAAEAIKWARAKPDDVHAAEALARIVDGWRRNCADGEPGKWELSRDAFRTLPRLHPQSEWAKRTRYWYR
jgi:hypothetical protein